VHISQSALTIECEGLNHTQTISPEQARELINYILPHGKAKTAVPIVANGDRPPSQTG
jgi:hypothetical protein